MKFLASTSSLALFIFFLALTPRIYHQYSLSGDPVRTALSPDEQAYETLAKLSKAPPDSSPEYFLNPLYPLILNVLKLISASPLILARWLNALLGAVSCLLIFLMARKYVSQLSAVIIGIIISLYGPLIFVEGKVLAESIAIFLIASALILYQKSREDSRIWNAVLGGLMMGLSVWARPNVILVWPVFWFDPLMRDGTKRRAVIYFQTAFAVMFLLMSAMNSIKANDLIVGTGSSGINFYLGNHIGAMGGYTPAQGISDNPLSSATELKDEAERLSGGKMSFSESDRFWLGKGLEFLSDDLGRAAMLWLRKTWLIIAPFETPQNINYAAERSDFPVLRLPLFSFVIIIPFSLIGMVVAWRNREKYFPFYAFIIAYSLTMIIYFVTGRYRLLLIPALAMFAAMGIDKIIANSGKRSIVRNWKWIAIPVALIIILSVVGHSSGDDFGRAWMWYNRGAYFQSVGMEKEAMNAYRRSLSYNVRFPETISNLNNLSVMLINSGRANEAESLLFKAISISPNNFRAHLNLGNVYFVQKDYLRAVQGYKKAISLRDDYAIAWRNLGLTYNKLDSLDASAQAFANALQINPDDSVSRNMLRKLTGKPQVSE